MLNYSVAELRILKLQINIDKCRNRKTTAPAVTAHAFTSTGYARAAAMLPATQRTQYNSIEDKIYYRISTA